MAHRRRKVTPFSETLRHLARLPGVIVAMTAGAKDGLIIENSDGAGARGDATAHRHTAALAAFLYSRSGSASSAAGLGAPVFMRLEAERGQLCVVGCGEIVLVALLESSANVGRIRLDMLTARNAA
jgi:predicted regulator of Ras-like GTPase activity (Roadblock/LC7/MglB family)